VPKTAFIGYFGSLIKESLLIY